MELPWVAPMYQHWGGKPTEYWPSCGTLRWMATCVMYCGSILAYWDPPHHGGYYSPVWKLATWRDIFHMPEGTLETAWFDVSNWIFQSPDIFKALLKVVTFITCAPNQSGTGLSPGCPENNGTDGFGRCCSMLKLACKTVCKNAVKMHINFSQMSFHGPYTNND